MAMQADFQPLGALPGGTLDSAALAVNADGTVVVGRSDSAEGTQAFRWTAETGLQGLGFLPGAAGSFAVDVSANGEVVTGSVLYPTGQSEAFRWTEATGMVGIGDLPGSQETSTATAISPDGTAIVGVSGGMTGTEAFLWTEAGGMQPLGDLPGGGFFSYAYDVSSQGETVVGISWSGSPGMPIREAFVWTAATGMQSLGMTDTGLLAEDATVVTPDGSQIFGYTRVGTAEIPFRWTAASGAVEFGTDAPNFVSAIPRSSSSDGQVVAFSDFRTVGNNTGRAGILLAGTDQVRSARNLLVQGGATGLSDSNLNYASVSLDGQAFAGATGFGGFQNEAWYATLEPLEPADVGSGFCEPQVPNSTGVAASLGGIGSTDTDLNFLRLEAGDMPLDQFGYFLASQTQGLTQQPGTSQGNLCLGGSIARYNADVFATGATGAASLTLDLANVPAPMGSVPVLAGETWSFQGWFRDENPVATSNFTTGLAVTFN